MPSRPSVDVAKRRIQQRSIERERQRERQQRPSFLMHKHHTYHSSKVAEKITLKEIILSNMRRIPHDDEEQLMQASLKIWNLANSYREMLYLMYQFYRGRLYGWPGYFGWFGEGDSKDHAKGVNTLATLTRYGVMGQNGQENMCGLYTDYQKQPRGLAYIRQFSYLECWVPKEHSREIYNALAANPKVDVFLFNAFALNESTTSIFKHSNTCTFNPFVPSTKLEAVEATMKKQGRNPHLLQSYLQSKYFTDADCKDMTLNMDEYSIWQPLEDWSSTPKCYLILSAKCNLFWISVKDACSSDTAEEILLETIKSLNIPMMM